MIKFKKWLEKKGIENYQEIVFGTNYFYNVPCPCHNAFLFCFELTNSESQTRETLETIETIKRYCSRYGYDVFNQESIFGGVSYTYFYVARKDARQALATYCHYMELSVNDCEMLRHKKGNYAGLNDDMKKIMMEYENDYITFLDLAA